MIIKHFLVPLLMASFQMFSQEVYINTGKNFSNYEYRYSGGQLNTQLQSGSGNYYEVGMGFPFTNEHFSYTLGLSLTDYNAIAGNTANSYRWDTKFLGLKGGFEYNVFSNKHEVYHSFDFILNAGFIGESIIYGKQEIDGAIYDLVHDNEFSGVVLESSIGCKVKYQLPSFGFLSVGYNFCYSVNVSHSSTEQLAFRTHQIGLGFHFPIN